MELSCDLIETIGNSLGIAEPALRLVLTLLAGYPLAFVHRKWLYGRAPIVQHLFFIVSGLALGYFNYKWEFLHIICTILISNALMAILGPTMICVISSFTFNMMYLLTGYYYASTDDYDINWTLPHCILVLRLIGLAFDYYDGNQPIESLSAENKKVALVQKPTIIEIFAHSLFPSSFLVGPQFPMRRYQQFVAGEFTANPKEAPDSKRAALNRFLLGMMYMIIYQTVSPYFSESFLLSRWYTEVDFVRKMFILGVWARITLYKYIACWLLVEGACILFGLTYNGKDSNGEPKWDGLQNVRVSLLENTTEFNDYILAFNINTNHWIAQYVYKRLKFLNNRFVSQAASLFFLALWHGFHSGYYVTFLWEFLIMYLEKDLKPLLKANGKLMAFLAQPPFPWLVYILLRIYTFVFFGWSLFPFVLLSYDRYVPVMASVHYIGAIIFLLYPFVYSPLLHWLLKPKTD